MTVKLGTGEQLQNPASGIASANVSVVGVQVVTTHPRLNNSTPHDPILRHSLILALKALVPVILPQRPRPRALIRSQDRIGSQKQEVRLPQVNRVRHLGVRQYPKVWNLLVVATTLDLTVQNRKAGGTNVNHQSTLDTLGRRKL